MISGRVKRNETEYRALPILSASDLKLFSTDRYKFFKKHILGEPVKEEYNRSIIIGNLVHTLLLEPEEFDNKFYKSICSSVPEGLMGTFIEALYEQTLLNTDENGQVTKDFEYISREAYSESGFKLSYEAVMNKFIDKTPEFYYKEIRESRSKGLTVICVSDIEIANKIIENVRQDENVGPIFNTEPDDESVFNELQIEGYSIFGLEMKSKLDKVFINHEKKEGQVIDAKACWNPQNFYYDYYLKRRAYIQAYVYSMALAKSGILPKGYLIAPPKFIVIDSGNFYSPLIYQLTNQDIMDAMNGFEDNGRRYPGVKSIIEELKWCQETGNWRMAREAKENNGIVNLKWQK